MATYTNIHELIGWHTCADLRCLRPLGTDPVPKVTTTRVRWFCKAEHIEEGRTAWEEALGHASDRDIDVWTWIIFQYRLHAQAAARPPRWAGTRS